MYRLGTIRLRSLLLAALTALAVTAVIAAGAQAKKQGAKALNAAFDTKLFTPGLPIGTATVTASG